MSTNNNSNISYEEYDSVTADRVNFLRAQLSIVDKAIGKVIDNSSLTTSDDIGDFNKTNNTSRIRQGRVLTSSSGKEKTILKSSSQVLTSGNGLKKDEGNYDQSFKIDTVSSQLATCPNCCAEMDTKKLKIHLSSQCPNKTITCPELNCGCTFMANELRKHIDKDCTIAKKRRGLLESAKIRKEMQAEEERKARELEQQRQQELRQLALENMSKMRENPENTQENSEKNEFSQENIEISHFITCPQCNESIKNSQLIWHLKDKCIMRKIMCPNIHCGCNERHIPLSLLQHHLQFNCRAELLRDLMIARSKVRHEPIQCTACGEFIPAMLLRKHEVERCENRRVPCRNQCLGCNVMVRLKERDLHEFVDGKRQQRHALYFGSHGSHMQINEDDISCPWTAEYWVYRPPIMESAKSQIRNILLQIPNYNLAYVAESCVKNKVLGIVRQLKLPINDSFQKDNTLSQADKAMLAKQYAQERIDLVNELTALVYVYNDTVLCYMKAFQNIAVAVELALSCCEEIIRTVAFKGSGVTATLRPHYPGAPPPPKPVKKITRPTTATATTIAAATETKDNNNNNTIEVSATTITVNNVDGIDTAEPNEAANDTTITESTELPEPPIDTDDPDLYFNEEDDNNDNSTKNITENDLESLDTTQNAMKTMEQILKINMNGLSSYIGSDNSMSVLFKECLESENKQLFLSVLSKIEQNSSSTDNSNSSNSNNNNTIFKPSVSTSELQSLGITALLYDCIVAPKSVAIRHDLLWSSWETLLETIAEGLRFDFNQLHMWRIEAGLIKPEDENSGKKKKKKDGLVSALTAEQEKAAQKKEQARKRRELKKRNKGTDNADPNSDSDNDDNNNSDGNTSDKNDTTNGNKNRKNSILGGDKSRKNSVLDPKSRKNSVLPGSNSSNIPTNTTPKVQEKLQKRITELFKANCGVDVIAESSCFSEENNYNKIVLSLNSGLSILANKTTASAAGSSSSGSGNSIENVANNVPLNYDVLIKPIDFREMIHNNGKIGIISNKIMANGKVHSGNELGNETHSFDVSVPRGKWSHIALVASTTPNNRVSLYMDGLFIKHLKDCAFPLPMSTLGGATTSYHTFEGALLDVRFWSKQRSAVEIIDSMHRLIELSDPGNPTANNSANTDNNGTSGHNNGNKHKDNNDHKTHNKKANNDASTALLDDGLVAWWTFEDGPLGNKRITDVTGHRFKTPFSRLPIKSESYPIPPEVVQMLPKSFAWMVPGATSNSTNEAEGANQPTALDATTTNNISANNTRPNTSNTTNTDINNSSRPHTNSSSRGSNLPVDTMLSSWPGTRWLDAELMPQGYKHKSAAAPLKNAKNNTKDDAKVTTKLDNNSKDKKPTKLLNIGNNIKRSSTVGRKKPPNAGSSTDKSKPNSNLEKPAVPNTTAAIKKPSSVPTSMFKDSGTLPVPSFRQRGLCPFEIRRFRLACSGREMQREVDCPLGCELKIRALDVRFHIKFECVQRIVPCRFDYCKGVFALKDRAKHESTDCAVFSARSELLNEYEAHNEESPCPQCSEPVKHRDMQHHCTAQCEHRYVFCPNEGCSKKTVKAHRFDYHLKYECDSPEVKHRRLLVRRARKRTNYARPWGLDIDPEPVVGMDLSVPQDINLSPSEDASAEIVNAENVNAAIDMTESLNPELTSSPFDV